MRIRRIASILLLAATTAALAATVQAREMWAVDLPTNGSNLGTTVALYNSGPTPEPVDVATAAGPAPPLTVPPGGVATLDLAGRGTGSRITSEGVYRFTAAESVNATAFNPIDPDPLSSDAQRLLPNGTLGREHYVFALSERNPGYTYAGTRGNLVVVATQDRTRVTVTPSSPTLAGPVLGALPAAAPATFTLQAFEALFLESLGDFTGSHVLSDRPVAVFAGHACVTVGTGACDRIVEQVPPTRMGGQTFVLCTSRTVSRDGFDLVRVMSVRGPANVTVDPPPPDIPSGTFTLAAAGAWREFNVTGDVVVEGSDDLLVAQYFGKNVQLSVGDPSFIVRAPLELGLGRTAVYAGSPVRWTTTVSVAAPAGTPVLLDGGSPGPWRPVGSGVYACASQSVLEGVHLVEAPVPVAVDVLAVRTQPTQGVTTWYTMDLQCQRAPPEPPRGLSGARSGMDFALSWDHEDGHRCPVTRFRVERADGSGAFLTVADLDALSRGAVDTVPYLCWTYRYRVVAVNEFGASAPAGPVTADFQAPFCVPPPPNLQPRLDDLPCRPVGLGTTVESRLLGSDPNRAPDPPRSYLLSYGATDPPEGARVEPDGTLRFVALLPGRFVFEVFVRDAGDPPMEDAATVCFLVLQATHPVAATDADGDGRPDTTDNCGAVDNPDQGDADGDGTGDVCDETPGTPAPEPTAPDVWASRMTGVDRDGDGVDDGIDVCPDVPDAAQADGDGDGTGDACARPVLDDACPGGASPPCGSPPSPSTVVGAAVAGGGAGSAAWFAAAVAAVLLLVLLRRRGAWFAFFTRIEDEDLLDHPVRRQVHDLVTADPGIHFGDLARRTGRAPGVVRHHVRRLVAGGLLRQAPHGRYMCYFPRSHDPEAARATGVLRTAMSREVLNLVQVEPGAATDTIALRLGATRGGVHYHLRRFEEAGLVRLHRDGRLLRAYPVRAKAGGAATGGVRA